MCESRQVNDQRVCGPCGLQWDINDPEPPTCQHKKGRLPKVVNFVRRLEEHDRMPIFNAMDIVNEVAGRVLSESDYRMCLEIARRSYKQGQDDLK